MVEQSLKSDAQRLCVTVRQEHSGLRLPCLRLLARATPHNSRQAACFAFLLRHSRLRFTLHEIRGPKYEAAHRRLRQKRSRVTQISVASV
jgi:hypothetical protein